MESYQGITVSEGIAIGKIHVIRRKEAVSFSSQIFFWEKEWEKITKAIEISEKQLEVIIQEARLYAGSDGASIFEAHQLLLKDNDFLGSIRHILEKKHTSAQKAVSETGEYYASMFASMDVEYMRERAADIRDIAGRIISNLEDAEHEAEKQKHPVILVSEYMTPSDIFRFNQMDVRGLATTNGSLTSHAAILAKSMEIPSIIAVPMNLDNIVDGTLAVIDSKSGRIILDPSLQVVEDIKCRMFADYGKNDKLISYVNTKSFDKNGKEISVCANIVDGKELEKVKRLGCDGIGLYRSEFLFMESENFPTETEQYYAYKTLASRMEGKPVVIRVVDIGSDKQLDYLSMNEEKNPALGIRGIRFLLTHQDIFRVQLRAILRAAADTNVKILYPMICSCKELEVIHEIVRDVAKELESENIPFSIPPQGIMIETPIAVMISDELAKQSDFFSIGTNDLTQYAMAADREDESLDMLYNQRNEGILQMIKMVIDAAHRHNIKAGICGELAADLDMIPQLIEMGIDELSVSSATILPLRKKIDESVN